MRRLRLPLFILSLLLLEASVFLLLWDNRFGGSLLAYLHQETPEERSAREALTRAHEKHYAQRLRNDALARLTHEDYENALTRLNEAAQLDPEGEDAGDIALARERIGEEAILVTGDAGR
jgi:hypothetical protein